MSQLEGRRAVDAREGVTSWTIGPGAELAQIRLLMTSQRPCAVRLVWGRSRLQRWSVLCLAKSMWSVCWSGALGKDSSLRYISPIISHPSWLARGKPGCMFAAAQIVGQSADAAIVPLTKVQFMGMLRSPRTSAREYRIAVAVGELWRIDNCPSLVVTVHVPSVMRESSRNCSWRATPSVPIL